MRSELQCIENIIPGLEVFKFQNIGLQEALFNKKMLLAFDTGTGKTFTYALFARALLNRDPEKKHVFIIIHDSLDQAVKDVRNLVCAPAAAFSGAAGELSKLQKMWNRLSVIIMTYECFRDMDTVIFLYNNLTQIESITIDEAHHASNWDESDTAFMIRSVCHYVPYVVGLTATPMTSRRRQFYQLLNTIDRSLSPYRDENFTGKYSEHYFPVNRGDYDIKGNYRATLALVTPQANQIGQIKGIISKVIKGTGAVPQVEALLRITEDRLHKGKSVIIYVNYHDSRRWVEKHLEMHNISFVSLHGKVTKMEERRRVLEDFKSRRVDVLVTSVSESLNIDADVVIFYEFTTKLKQVMGRAHRGLDAKELELVFLITKDTMEVDFFMKYIYERSLTIQRILRKDYKEFIEIGNQLKQMELNEEV